MTWSEDEAGVVRFPSGKLIRGRGHRRQAANEPTFGVYLLGREPAAFSWDARWVKWHDFWLPSDKTALKTSLFEALERAAHDDERVEVACDGGIGRTGTALACMAILDGMPADQATAFIRKNYNHRAVETPWQRQFVRKF